MRRRRWRRWAAGLAGVLLLALLVRAELADFRVIPTASMAPTVLPGDWLLFEKLTPRFTGLRRGEIVLFRPPCSKEVHPVLRTLGIGCECYVKRVIGLPGETVEVRDGQVLIDGRPLAERYILEPPCYHCGPVTVPSGQLFVLGDNRNNSSDSHCWGCVEQRDVMGRAVLRLWPPGRAGGL